MLLFLHGFLGDKRDWDPLFSHLPHHIEKVAIDLPGHGGIPFTPEIEEWIHEKAQALGATTLIGYSAGGRIALSLKESYPQKYERVIALSTGVGITSFKERTKRIDTDREWARKLREEPFSHFLEAWYDQPLFSHLKNHPQFPKMLKQREEGDPKSLALFLETMSPGRKNPPEISQETIFLFGNKDLKYASLYRTLSPTLQLFEVPKASHAIHLENPKRCAEIITGVVNDPSTSPSPMATGPNLPRH